MRSTRQSSSLCRKDSQLLPQTTLGKAPNNLAFEERDQEPFVSPTLTCTGRPLLTPGTLSAGTLPSLKLARQRQRNLELRSAFLMH